MKFVVERTAFLKALGHVQNIVERRNILPVLTHVLLDADSRSATLAATDREVELRERMSVEASRPGSVVAPAHLLYEIVRRLPAGAQIALDADSSGRLSLVSGTSSFVMQTLPREDFPLMAHDDAAVEFSIPGPDLHRLIGKTRFAASVEDARYFLNGVHFHPTDDGAFLRAVATDGHRLARAHVAAPKGSADAPPFIVPRKAVGEIWKLTEDETGDVVIRASATRIVFALTDVVLTSKLIDGRFPDYARVIPTRDDNVLKVEAAALARSVDRVSAISNEKVRGVTLSIDATRLKLSASHADVGTAEDEIDASYVGTPLSVGFNARYLTEILERIDADTAVLIPGDAASPALVHGDGDTDAVYVLMPMRI